MWFVIKGKVLYTYTANEVSFGVWGGGVFPNYSELTTYTRLTCILLIPARLVSFEKAKLGRAA